jgi:tRNA/rRNA methyltransferase
VGAEPLLARAEEFKTVAEAVADCSLVVGTTALNRRGPQHPVWNLQQSARLIRKRLTSSGVALLFGSEKRGLSNEDLSHCHWLLHIPAREAHRSMNLGQAVAVCLYELARGTKSVTKSEKPVAAAAADLERLTTTLFDALYASGYVKTDPKSKTVPQSPALAIEKIRRFVRRLNLSAEDAELFLGILRQILWKLRS